MDKLPVFTCIGLLHQIRAAVYGLSYRCL